MLSNVKRTYALDMFTVENRGGKWYFSRSGYDGDKHDWKAPYSSMASLLQQSHALGDEEKFSRRVFLHRMRTHLLPPGVR